MCVVCDNSMRWELPCINNVMVSHPFKKVPVDICPREEIASPSKLLALCQLTANDWDEYDMNGTIYQRAWIQMRIRYPSLSKKVSSLGFYGLVQDPDMLASILSVSNDVSSQLQWLREFALKPIIVTIPLISYRTKYQEVLYTISNTFPQRTIQVSPITDLTDQMLANNAYTICNGLTLALALHRLGFWADPIFHVALTSWFEENENIYTDITPEIQPLFVQHLIPQVCDHPFFYACMGRQKATIPVIEALRVKLNIMEPFIQQHNATYSIATNASLQMLPYTPMNVFDHLLGVSLVSQFHNEEDQEENQQDEDQEDQHDESTTDTRIDLGGLMQAIVTQKGVWKRWKSTYRDTLLRFQGSAEHNDEFLDRFMKRSFMLYTKGCHVGRVYTSRIRTMWRQVMDVLDPEKTRMQKWIHKYVLLSYIGNELNKRGVFGAIWLPKVPVAFLIEMSRVYGAKWKIFSTSNPISVYTSFDEIRSMFPSASFAVNETADRPYKIYQIQQSIMHYMSRMPRDSSLHFFYRMMKNKSQMNLRLLRCAFMRPTIPRLEENEAYTLWTILQDYFTDHKEELCL